MSPSSRRAWIEICWMSIGSVSSSVALLAEGVDRNSAYQAFYVVPEVALLAEGVDRNLVVICTPPAVSTVALLAEGVDRNWTSCGIN